MGHARCIDSSMFSTRAPEQKGVAFPKALFRAGSERERIATFDAAYDLACQRLGVSIVDALVEEDQVHFLPTLSGVG